MNIIDDNHQSIPEPPPSHKDNLGLWLTMGITIVASLTFWLALWAMTGK